MILTREIFMGHMKDLHFSTKTCISRGESYLRLQGNDIYDPIVGQYI